MNPENTVGVIVKQVSQGDAIAKTEAELTGLGAKADATAASGFSKFNDSLKTAGTQLSAAGRAIMPLSLGVAAVGALSIKSAITFQQQMTYIRTQAGDTTDSISKLSQQVLELSKRSQYSPTELAQGLFHLASLGLRGADAMKALDSSQRLAAVGGAQLEATTSAVGAAMVTGIRGTEDLNRAAGTLNATIGAGNMRMDDLVGALGTGILPVFKNAGLSLNDFGAALATLTDNGMEASNAATRLRMTIALMEAPSKKAQDVLAGIGMSANQLAMDMQTKGLVPALEDVQRHLLSTYGTTAEGKTKMAAALTEMFGGGRSSAAIQTLLDQIPRVQTKLKQISEDSGQFANSYAEQQQTASAKIKTAWSTIQADAIDMGSKWLPGVANAFSRIANDVDKAAAAYDHLGPVAKRVLGDMAIAVALGGPLLVGVGKLATGLNAILTLATSVGGKLGFLGAAEGGGAAGIAGEMGGMGAAAATAAPAIGSVALAVGAIAAVGIGAAAIIHRLSVEHANAAATAARQADSEAKVAAQAKSVGGAHQVAMNNIIGYNKAVNNAAAATNDLKAYQMTARTAQLNFNQAVNAAQQALKQYGPNSKQYQDALVAQAKANQTLTHAQQALTGAQHANSSAQDAAAKATASLSAAYYIGQQNSARLKQLTDQLRAAKGSEQEAHTAVTRAMGSYNTVLMLTGPNSRQTAAAAADLANKQNNLDSATARVHSITSQLNQVHKDAATEAKNLKAQIDALGNSYAAMGNKAAAAAQQESNAQSHSGFLGSIKKALGFATGTGYAPGGWSVVGEQGPEMMYVPRGAQVRTASESTSSNAPGGGGQTTVHIDKIYLGTPASAREFFRQLNQDILNLGKGLTAVQGAH